jgi:glycosyltransferase involved in cell wall biosynthesis
LKILIVQPWIRLGGAEMVSVNLAVNLDRQGHDVSIACTFVDLNGAPPQASQVRYLLPDRRISGLLRRSRIMFLLFGPWILLWLVWRNSGGVDILNPHEFPSSWIAAAVGRLRRLPVIWTSYGPPPRPKLGDLLNLGLFDWVGWSVASSCLDRAVVRTISSIHVPSQRSCGQILERYHRDARAIPLGVDIEFYQSGDAGRCLTGYGLAGRFVLLCVGKMHPQENQIICLHAMKSVLRVVENAYLILAGDGPMKTRWERTAEEIGIADHVKFIGHVAASEVRDLYRACAIHLFPPTNESWGLAPFEALCARRISIVSDESGAAELMAKENIGIVCRPTAEQFAREILRLYSDPVCASDMAARGHDYVSKRLSWDRFAAEVSHLMSESKPRAAAAPDGLSGQRKVAG